MRNQILAAIAAKLARLDAMEAECRALADQPGHQLEPSAIAPKTVDPYARGERGRLVP